MSLLTVILLVFTSIVIISGKNKYSVEIVLERCEFTCYDRIFENCSSKVQKFGRNSSYVLDAEVYIKYIITDNITTSLKSYEWKNNQFKESFIAFNDVNFCTLLNKNIFLVPIIKKYSNMPASCPIQSGWLRVDHLIIEPSYFPPVFPIGRWKFESKSFRISPKTKLVSLDLIFTVRQVLLKRKT